MDPANVSFLRGRWSGSFSSYVNQPVVKILRASGVRGGSWSPDELTFILTSGGEGGQPWDGVTRGVRGVQKGDWS